MLFRINDLLKNKKTIAARYYEAFNRKLDFKKFDTFTAYIQHTKLMKSSEDLWPLTDKYAVRTHVAQLIGEKYLVKLLGVWDQPEEIDYSQLPKRFVLKTNHGSAWNIIVPDAMTLDKQKTHELLKGWLSTNYYSVTLEPHYRKIKPKILAEEYLMDSKGELLDYKFFCFHGQPYFLQVDIGRFTPHHCRAYLNLEWERLPFTTLVPMSERMPDRPDNFEEMLQIVKILAQKHVHVRVDLYNIDGRIVFGELTFTHGSGFEKFYPDNTYDFLIGNLITKRPYSTNPLSSLVKRCFSFICRHKAERKLDACNISISRFP